MDELRLNWDEFVEKYKSNEITATVDLNKGHALMKSQHAPAKWRITIKLLTWLSLLATIGSIPLFFYLKWWIPIIIIVLSISVMRAIRQEAAKAVVTTSLENDMFYFHAINSGIMKVIPK